MPRTIRTPKTRARFLEALSETCNVVLACKLSRLPRRSAYDWRRDDALFKADWEEAIEQGGDVLEAEAIRRATKGVKKPIYQMGQRVGYVQEYSDSLLIFLLKGAKPKKYADRTTVGGDPNNPVVHKVSVDELIERIVGRRKK